MTATRTRSRKTRRTRKVQTWPLALAVILIAVIWTHPIVGLVIGLALVGVVLGVILGTAMYVVQVWRGKARPPARITRDKKNGRWSVEFL